jgi:hypothetical protein
VLGLGLAESNGGSGGEKETWTRQALRVVKAGNRSMVMFVYPRERQQERKRARTASRVDDVDFDRAWWLVFRLFVFCDIRGLQVFLESRDGDKVWPLSFDSSICLFPLT